MSNLGLFLALLFVLKHYIADFRYQTTWMALNKGTFMHPGGLAHVGIHGLASFATFAIVIAFYHMGKHASAVAVILIAAEVVLHYFIDYCKMNIDKRAGWSKLFYKIDPQGGDALSNLTEAAEGRTLAGRFIRSPKYYDALGIDQCLHFATYAFMIWAFTNL